MVKFCQEEERKKDFSMATVASQELA